MFSPVLVFSIPPTSQKTTRALGLPQPQKLSPVSEGQVGGVHGCGCCHQCPPWEPAVWRRVSLAGVVPRLPRTPQVQGGLDLGLASLLSEVTGLVLDPEAFPLRPGAGPRVSGHSHSLPRHRPPPLNWHYWRFPCTEWVLWP